MTIAEQRQGIHTYMSIFDMKIGKALNLSDHMTVRIMFSYDEGSKRKEFDILSNHITPQIKQKIYGWLKDTIVDFEIIKSLRSKVMDADRLLNVVNL